MSKSITKTEFNFRFLAALDAFDPDLRHLGTGSAFHPRLRAVLLQEVKQDIELDGWPVALGRWRHFIGY
jgi:hypothetical protein